MSLADITWTDLTLTPVATLRERGEDEAVSGLIAFGTPLVLDSLALARAAGAELDAEIKLLAPTHRFSYVRFALSLRPRDDHDIAFVALDIVLETPGGQAICWSMQPMRVDQQIKARAETKVSAKLDLELVAFGGEAKEAGEFVIYQPTVEAFNVQRSDPAWELKAVPGRKLSGTQLFHMVVRVPDRSTCTARVSLRADISRKGFLWNYRARRPDESEQLALVNV